MYVMEEMPDIHKTGERVLYPRFAMVNQVSTHELARSIASASSFSDGEVEGVLREIAAEMERRMAEGCSVRLDGIGVFTPSLALREGKEREEVGENATHRNAQSIVVGGINFRVDRALVERVNGRCYLERAPWKSVRSSQKYTLDERKAKALKYLETHPYLTVYEYRTLTGLLQTAATNELREWAHQSGAEIDISGRGSHRVYVLRAKADLE